ncbi:uncharacterized protein N7503_000513 [Penicillium pulvis]|uniref:uncharacterized protein n=1 Tax=Penicillium pulvis TaxID=1562058 RepID=UPI002549418E|nr:uncharacterized protein N7503_000513 [Penicillium pulvis]KAJ5813763.1 hypothetical protein N7503_000513 [Penicillium pulvis]
MTPSQGHGPLDNDDFTRNCNVCHILKKCCIVIVGAGFGGLLFAVRLIQTGFRTVDEIKIVDEGRDFGGTWHWNQATHTCPCWKKQDTCQCETHRGIEIQEHAAQIAKKWDLVRRTSFKTSVNNLAWHEPNCFLYATMKISGACGFVQVNFVYLATNCCIQPRYRIFRA